MQLLDRERRRTSFDFPLHGYGLGPRKAHQGPINDCANSRPLLDEVVPGGSIGTVLADAERDSERNHQHIRKQIGARGLVIVKSVCSVYVGLCPCSA
jgi:hypothetical protein